ncbi:MAG TPA: cyclodeaminase/cyclohydrolase family protein [Polyangiaceae bacterium]|nr:cyclodeaminase/cyclohydrolase family protein [Polyangiaceae bacterium]
MQQKPACLIGRPGGVEAGRYGGAVAQGRVHDRDRRDADAFHKVMDGFEMPKATDEQEAARMQVIQEGMKQATLVPFRCSRGCLARSRLRSS